MISSFEEGPPTNIKAIREILIVVKQSSATETPQLSLNYESCEELRRERFDETSILAGASL